jgi:hypothetical protein
MVACPPGHRGWARDTLASTVSGPIALSSRATLLVPVDAADVPARDAVEIDGVRLVRKAEHHITVFGFDIGRQITAAASKVPTLKAELDALAAAADFRWRIPESPQWWRLHRDAPRDLQTIVLLVDAPGIASFFAACEARCHEVAPGAALGPWDPPPPHITVYTSDPSGKDGIGLRRPADLSAAEARGVAGEHTGLRAFRWQPDAAAP